MHEEQLLKNRLLYDTRAIKKLYKRFLLLLEGFESQGNLNETRIDPTEQTDRFNNFLIELSSFEYWIKKHELMDEMAQKEISMFQLEAQDKEQEILATKAEIEMLKRKLEEAERGKAQKIEYDVMAKQILKLPSRSKTLSQIEQVEKELGRQKIQIDATAESIEIRKSQAKNIVETIYNLQAEMKQSSEEEAQRLVDRLAQETLDDQDGHVDENEYEEPEQDEDQEMAH